MKLKVDPTKQRKKPKEICEASADGTLDSPPSLAVTSKAVDCNEEDRFYHDSDEVRRGIWVMQVDLSLWARCCDC